MLELREDEKFKVVMIEPRRWCITTPNGTRFKETDFRCTAEELAKEINTLFATMIDRAELAGYNAGLVDGKADSEECEKCKERKAEEEKQKEQERISRITLGGPY